MAGKLPSESTYHGMLESSPYKLSNVRHEEGKMAGWYFSRKEIEENSPSRKDGIDLKKETYLWKSYCTFLQDLGMRLKVPQVTIATAIVFCHRFFLRQSHAKNDRRTIATVCMFLAGKVEETPRSLKDVILVSYDIIHKKDPVAAQRIKQREVFEQQKELILIGERLVLATLGFDLNVLHPYKHLVEAIKKFKVAQNTLAQVAWNFVNDGLRTSLCLQFKPHHVAAGAIFLAAKFLKVKLPSDGEKVWWQELDVTPRQLEEVSNQMLELYEQNRLPQSHGNETEGSSAAGTIHHAPPRASSHSEETVTEARSVHVSKAAPLLGSIPVSSSTSSAHNQSYVQKQNGLHGTHTEAGDDARHEQRSNKLEACIKDESANPESLNNHSYYGHAKSSEVPSMPATEAPDTREKNNGSSEDVIGSSPMLDAIKKIDKDKVKAALEKRRKARADAARKADPVDEDDLIERELEHGVELAAEDERSKLEKGYAWSKCQNSDRAVENGFHRTDKSMGNAEGGLSLDARTPSPVAGSHKRRAISPSSHHRLKDGHNIPPNQLFPPKYRDRDSFSDGRPVERLDHAERDHKRHRQDF